LPALALLLVEFPVPSLVVTVVVSSGVEADPSPVVPTAYNWMVAPVTGCCPPKTVPEIVAFCAMSGVVDAPQPVSTKGIATTATWIIPGSFENRRTDL
jgi:hypothetical protein